VPRSARDDELVAVGSREDPALRQATKPEEPADEVGDNDGAAAQHAAIDRDGEDEVAVVMNLDVGPDRRLGIVVRRGAIRAEPAPPIGTAPELLVVQPVADGADRHRMDDLDAANELVGSATVLTR
jgi:hypothetical protein